MLFSSTARLARAIRYLGLVLLLGVWVTLLPASAGAQSNTSQRSADAAALETQISEARAIYERQRLSLEGDRAAYESYLEEVYDLREARSESGIIASDEDVRDALREAREMAVDLQRESEGLRQLSGSIREMESSLVGLLDARTRELERSLAGASSDERRLIMAELAELSETRAGYLEPLAPVPEVALDQILLGLDDEATTPEELEATADELSDHERRLEEHLEELDRHILQLELRERDRVFRSEASLFEEGQNSGRREERSSSTQSDSGNDDGQQAEQPTAGGQDEPNAGPGNEGGAGAPNQPSDSPALDGDSGEVGGEDETPGAGVDGGFSDPTFEGTDGNRDSSGDGFTSEPPEPGDVTSGGGVDDFEPTPSAPSISGVTRSVQDPTQLIMLNTDEAGSTDSERSTNGRLQRLRDEREQTESTLERVQQQRRLLLERVDELEELEGF